MRSVRGRGGSNGAVCPQREQTGTQHPRTERASSASPPTPRPRVEIMVHCTLEQMGGWQPVKLDLSAWSAALGVRISEQMAMVMGLPLSLSLPPGSCTGDTLLHTLPKLGSSGADVSFVLMGKPHRRWERRGDKLQTTLTLPAWHNLLCPPVRVRGVDGKQVRIVVVVLAVKLTRSS